MTQSDQSDQYAQLDETALRQQARDRGVDVPAGADENALREALRRADQNG
jgi:hypothetical protein